MKVSITQLSLWIMEFLNLFFILFFQEASTFISTKRYESEDWEEEPAKKLEKKKSQRYYTIILYEFQNKREAAASW